MQLVFTFLGKQKEINETINGGTPFMYFHVCTATLFFGESILSYSKVAKNIKKHICFCDQGFNCFWVFEVLLLQNSTGDGHRNCFVVRGTKNLPHSTAQKIQFSNHKKGLHQFLKKIQVGGFNPSVK